MCASIESASFWRRSSSGHSGLRPTKNSSARFTRPIWSASTDKKLFWNVSDNLIGIKISHDIVNPKTKEVICHAGKKISHSIYNLITKAHITHVEISPNDLEGCFTVADVVSRETGEVLLESNQELKPNTISAIIDAGITEFSIFYPERDDVGVVLSQTMRKDTIKTTQEALIEIYRKMRPGDPPTLETATNLFEGMFFDSRKYDFSRVGRLKFNIKLDLNSPLDKRTLEPDDFYAVIRYLLKLRKNIGQVDDIDHLGNRRVRAVGELLENQFRIGLVRMERAIKEKMSVYQEMSTAMPHDLINAKPVMAAVREFFGSSPAFAVHGPDQPAFGDHAQTPSFRTGPGWFESRARRI